METDFPILPFIPCFSFGKLLMFDPLVSIFSNSPLPLAGQRKMLSKFGPKRYIQEFYQLRT